MGSIFFFAFGIGSAVFFVWGLRVNPKDTDLRTKMILKWIGGGYLWPPGDPSRGWRMRLYSAPLGIAMGLFGGIALLVTAFTQCR